MHQEATKGNMFAWKPGVAMSLSCMVAHLQKKGVRSGPHLFINRVLNFKGQSMAGKNTIKDLLTDEIKDLYSAEKQLTKALPRMVKSSNDATLKEAFAGHLKETREQVTRLEEVGQLLGIKVTGKKCVGMEGCVKEGAEALEEKGEDVILDLALIGAGSRVEHYEMAGYMTAISLARRMGAAEVVRLLQQSLAEEEGAGKKLRQIASGLIKTAISEDAKAA